MSIKEDNMKFKHKMYKKIADYFYAKLPVEEPNVELETGEEPNEPPSDLLVALNEKISSTPLDSLVWSNGSEKDGFHIKHINREFSLCKIGADWEVKVAIGSGVVFTTTVPKSKSNLRYINQIFADMHDKAMNSVVELLKAGTKPETTKSE